jgi:hypothetical protein
MAASCGLERSAPIAPTGMGAPIASGELLAEAAGENSGTVTVVAMTEVKGKGWSIDVGTGALLKVLVSKMIPEDKPGEPGSTVARTGRAVGTGGRRDCAIMVVADMDGYVDEIDKTDGRVAKGVGDGTRRGASVEIGAGGACAGSTTEAIGLGCGVAGIESE